MFGPGLGNIYGRRVSCTGAEDRLTDCNFEDDVSTCTHLNDAGIRCNINSNYK